MLHLANAVIDPATGKSLEYRQIIKRDDYRVTWTRSFANELGRLAQGVGDRITGTNTIVFIPQSAVPIGQTVTYGRIVVDIRPQKDEPERANVISMIVVMTIESVTAIERTTASRGNDRINDNCSD
jgi:hypothetical protein